MASNYNRFLAVLKKWPKASLPNFENYGDRLRALVQERNLKQTVFSDNVKEDSSKINSLIRLADNKYENEYPQSYKHGATGFTPEELKKYLPIIIVKNEKKKTRK